MKGLSRRSVLGSAGGVLIAGAGCLSQSKPNAKICFISIKNLQQHAVDAHLRIEDASKTVLRKKFHLENYTGTVKSSKASVELLKRPVERSGQYSVKLTTNGTSMHVDTTTVIDGKTDAVGIIFNINSNSPMNYEANAYDHCD